MRNIINKNNVRKSVRRVINFIEGSNITLTIDDNAAENRTDITIESTGGGGVSDGLKGDINVSGTSWTIVDSAVTNDKISDVDASKVTQNSSNRFVTDTEKSTWNSKADGTHTHAISDITNLQTELDGKANVLSRDTALVLETDFYNVTSPFSQGLTGTAVSSGTVTAIAAVPNHPGIVALRDSTTANGGYRVMTDVTAFRIAGGEKFVCSFQVRSARATTTSYMGFFDSTTNVAPTDAACFVITANGSTITMRGRTRANNTATDTVITFNPSINTWYTAIIEVNSNASSVNFSIFNESGTNVYSQDLANLPTAAGRETGAGVAAYESTTDAASDILYLDYLRIELNRTLTR